MAAGRAEVEERTMVTARLDDGESLLALNEIFVGHRSHQSARYRLRLGAQEERQSSSGLIVATGTGATGWARSINRGRARPLPLPTPTDPALALFVREPFPSVSTGTRVDGAVVDGRGKVEVVSEMDDGAWCSVTASRTTGSTSPGGCGCASRWRSSGSTSSVDEPSGSRPEVSDTWVWAAGQVRVRGGARFTGCRTRVFSFPGAVRRGSER